ncbi:Protein kinase superfamily protein [Abeliophyllum distichum]|uniref:Protein kinase superfamily protein n=1 Tax=Abeliophyllum distichum TaxID=126358 RepID=A0ABD1Q0C2_9LAMI
MGCVSSRNATFESPEFDVSSSSSTAAGRRNGSGRLHSLSSLPVKGAFGRPLEKIKEESEEEKEGESVKKRRSHVDHSGNLRALKRGASEKNAVFSIKFGRLTESDNVAAGWPTWLSAVAGEAIEGWLPLRSDAFEKLEKIGQGTYSNVYRARNVETGNMVALKKVSFDNFQPESVRFMAREIMILRKLDHPNIMKLEGIITSRLSCNIYLVFEYMEHDLVGLLSCPDIKFSDAQIKCYMRQLLCGLEHCHSQGVSDKYASDEMPRMAGVSVVSLPGMPRGDTCHVGWGYNNSPPSSESRLSMRGAGLGGGFCVRFAYELLNSRGKVSPTRFGADIYVGDKP